MLTKHQITSGAYLENFGEVPKEIMWTLERIERSMRDTLATRPTSGDLWIFGYGSLLWNPLLSFAGQQPATLHGWHRSFCMRIIAGRATVETPGRMLALEPGGSTQGVAFRLTEQVAQEELLLLWIREMPTGAYRPLWAPLSLDDGTQVTALVFVAEPDHPLYEADARIESIAPFIAEASGPMGSNADYVHKLNRALCEVGFVDAYIDALSTGIAL
ncbi:gamma-glutamylcyclotransferase [Pseudomonas gingeri]|uniref:glutathione-specific gamma-glutamylcyclotransferase n=2 Tax=Pseudomonas gingeri TaxID=117681 RepID=A0A7Y7YDJ8_9PSED|nr:gamma-glutamylcyclotransferase [Pseudomonas gingeri]NWA14141.1 gamma-glutamylcyclotransferase [Pseudomonas gingeri]NWA55241.1 gamma-glutamylcyclotransferase [Pseudomonas gingeri]NWA94965.1 gamma-glutamylcyclotransferase [Pseudomonas gingeri]NWB01621.1 gamma-glutamylcyclotransferase [Pseudomonas gingeri]